MVSTEIIKNWGGQNGGGAENNLGGGAFAPPPPLAPPGAATACRFFLSLRIRENPFGHIKWLGIAGLSHVSVIMQKSTLLFVSSK